MQKSDISSELKLKETRLTSIETIVPELLTLIKKLSERIEILESKNAPPDVKTYSFF